MDQEMILGGDMAKAIYKKCGQCAFLNGDKCSIGIACTNPEKVWKRESTKYHQKWTKACKLFTPTKEGFGTVKCEIPLKLPSLNDYVRVCRANAFQASKFKKDLEHSIELYIRLLPRFENPVQIHFHWVEGNKRRDLDNIAFAKKFILDAMVKAGKLMDDNRKCVTAFTDTFSYGKETKVLLEIQEV